MSNGHLSFSMGAKFRTCRWAIIIIIIIIIIICINTFKNKYNNLFKM